MSELGKFIAFQAAVALIKERGYDGLLSEVAASCGSFKDTKPNLKNHVKRVAKISRGRNFSKGCRTC